MKNSSKRRGFTLVELLVVIAILAVLATVAILGYTQFTRKANISNDQAICNQMNLALQANEALDNKAKYPSQAVQQCIEAGFILENLTPSTADFHFAYDQQYNRFMLLEKDFSFNYGDENHSDFTIEANKVNVFVVVGDKTELDNANDKNFSTYLRETFDPSVTTIDTDKGIDVGDCTTITSINYHNEGDGQEVVIRTNSLSTILSINAPKDTIKHYEFAALVKVISCASTSYDEYGTVGRLIAENGHIEAMDGCEIFCLMDNRSDDEKAKDETDGSTKPTINEGAVVHKDIDNINADEGVSKNQKTGVGTGYIYDCGAGRHAFDEHRTDYQYDYDICTCCGYTLITVKANVGLPNEVEFKQTLNKLDTNGKETETVVTPANEYILTVSASGSIPTKLVEGKTVLDIDNLPAVGVAENGKIPESKVQNESIPEIDDKDNPINPSCKHEYVYLDNGDGTHTKKCFKCGLTYKAEKHIGNPCICGFNDIPTDAKLVEQGYVVRVVGGDGYMSLQEGMLALHENDTLKVLQDITLTSQTTDGLSAQKCIIDLNGKTITASGTWKLSNTIKEYMTYDDILDWLGKEDAEENFGTREEYEAGTPYLLGMTENPVDVTIVNGTYIVNGTDSGRIRFENGSTGRFEKVTIKSSSKTKTYQGLQTYAWKNDGKIEKNVYSFKDCSFKNVYLSFEGASGSCNKYDISFEDCDFDITTNKNGFSAIAVNTYNYGDLSIENCTFDISGSASGGAAYAFNINSSLSSTNGKTFDVVLVGTNIHVSGNANPYMYSFAYVYNANPTYYGWNANVECDNKCVFTKDGKTVEPAIREQAPTSKSLVWVENSEAFTACYAEWLAYVKSSPACASYNSYNYYLVECDGYYFVMGQGQQYAATAVITIEGNTVVKVLTSASYGTTYNTIGETDISLELGESNNANVHIYTLSK